MLDLLEVAPRAQQTLKRETPDTIELNPFVLPDFSPREIAGLSSYDIQRAIDDERKLFLQENPRNSESIDQTANELKRFFGIHHDRMQQVQSPEQRRLPTALTHELVHNMYYAGGRHASQGFTEYIYSIIRLFETIRETTGKSPSMTETAKWWAGVKAHFALIKFFSESGYTVIGPDYTKVDPQSKKIDEVLEIDIRSGIDFICISPDKKVALCIDAKSRPDFSEEERVLTTEVISGQRIDGHYFSSGLYALLNRMMLNTNGRIYCAEIKLRQNEITPLKKRNLNHRNALAQFGSLQNDVGYDILEDVDYFTNHE